MQTLTQPSILLKPFADQGDRNVIPDVNTDTSEPQRADFTNGYPAIVSLPPDQGGLPPERKDFNALGYLTTTYDFFYQAGGVFTFNPTISTAIGGYPEGARLWHTDSDGRTVLLRSAIGNNTNNFLTDPTVIGHRGSGKPWIIEQFAGVGLKLPILSFTWADHQLNDVSWLRADTFSWQDGDVYAAAYNHLVNDIDSISASTETIGGYTITYYLASDGHKIVLANMEEIVANIYATTGVAWYYVLDTTNTRFKLPRTKFGLTGYRGQVGNYIAPGLPIPAITSNATTTERVKTDQEDQTHWVATGANTATISIVPDNIYGQSTTVQPPATQMYLYFYVGDYEQSALEQTAGLNSELFNGKLDLNAANLSTAGKSLVSGLGMPSTRYENLTLGASGTAYMAPANGYYSIRKTAGVANGWLSLNTSVGVGYTVTGPGTGNSMWLSVPVKKGDTVSISYNMTGTTDMFRFIYAEGEPNV